MKEPLFKPFVIPQPVLLLLFSRKVSHVRFVHLLVNEPQEGEDISCCFFR